MFSLDGYQPVDLSASVTAHIYRVDGSVEEGTLDPYGKPWVMQEGRFAGDNSLYTLFCAEEGDPLWPDGRHTTHHGSHVQGGAGHISHWASVPEDMKGIWEMPVEAFMGEAVVCDLSHLAPVAIEDPGPYPGSYPLGVTREGEVRGQEIKPEHLSNIKIGDIVLMTSSFTGQQQPWLSPETAKWLVEDRKIKMLGVSAEGVLWDYAHKKSAPNNSPVKRQLLGANVPVAHPLVNIDKLSKERVFYFGLPLIMTKMEASFIRAVAFEEIG